MWWPLDIVCLSMVLSLYTSMLAPLSPGSPDEWRGLLTDNDGGGHYFDSDSPPPEALGLALLHPNMAGSVGPSFTRLLARSQCALVCLFSTETLPHCD